MLDDEGPPPEQGNLWGWEDRPVPVHTAGESRMDELEEQARNFHAKNPWVWREFCKLTFQAMHGKRRVFSAYAIFEILRWNMPTPEHAKDGKDWKLNNNHRPFYSRWFMAAYPKHAGYFRTRRQTSAHRRATGLPEQKPGDYTTYPNDDDPVAP